MTNCINRSNVILPLLRRTQLFPAELLPSLLARLVQYNYYPNMRTLTYICSGHSKYLVGRDNLAYPRQAETFVKLAQLTGIAPEMLFNASQNRLALLLSPQPPLTVPINWMEDDTRMIFSGQMAKKHLHTASLTQYCPICLRASAYHRVEWWLVATTVCTEHCCLLVNACPQCGQHLSIREVVRRRCGACLADLCAAPVTSIAEDELGLCSQRLIHNWFWETGSAPEPLSTGRFPAMAPILLYHILENLFCQLLTHHREWHFLPSPFCDLLENIPSSNRRLRYLSPKMLYCLYKVAFTGLFDWPCGLFNILDACCGHFIPNFPVSGRLQRLILIQQECLHMARHAGDFDLVQQVFTDYVTMRNLF